MKFFRNIKIKNLEKKVVKQQRDVVLHKTRLAHWSLYHLPGQPSVQRGDIVSKIVSAKEAIALAEFDIQEFEKLITQLKSS
jgi:hypothetical protein